MRSRIASSLFIDKRNTFPRNIFLSSRQTWQFLFVHSGGLILKTSYKYQLTLTTHSNFLTRQNGNQRKQSRRVNIA